MRLEFTHLRYARAHEGWRKSTADFFVRRKDFAGEILRSNGLLPEVPDIRLLLLRWIFIDAEKMYVLESLKRGKKSRQVFRFTLSKKA